MECTGSHVSLRVKRALKRRDPRLVPRGGTDFTDVPEGGQGRFLKVNREELGGLCSLYFLDVGHDYQCFCNFLLPHIAEQQKGG